MTLFISGGAGGIWLHSHFLEENENRGVDPVKPVSSNSPPDWHGICQGEFPFEGVGAANGRPHLAAVFCRW